MRTPGSGASRRYQKQYENPIVQGTIPAQSDLTLFVHYVQEIYKPPLLTAEEEFELGRLLKKSRERLTGLFTNLPETCGDFVLGCGADNLTAAADWSVGRLEIYYQKLLMYASSTGDAAIRKILRRASYCRLRLDWARDTLVRRNLRFVIHLVKQFCGKGIPDLDLIQEGNIALIKAVEKFEYDRGYRLLTYAHWWIRQGIARELSRKTHLIRIPESLQREARNAEQVARALSARLGREPSHEEVAQDMKIPIKRVRKPVRILRAS
ncbi:MAG: sigma-70 family RNA polymerase sigma factor [Acidobacteriota bacterium]